MVALSLAPVESELRGRFPDLGLSLEISPWTDEIFVKDRSGSTVATVSGMEICATPKNQLVELFKNAISKALEVRSKQ